MLDFGKPLGIRPDVSRFHAVFFGRSLYLENIIY
jgi:hypothetical protein